MIKEVLDKNEAKGTMWQFRIKKAAVDKHLEHVVQVYLSEIRLSE